MRSRTLRALPLALVAALSFAVLGPKAARESWASVTATHLVIMPLGDSVTYGTSPGGYRAPLYQDLAASGLQASFVGSSTENPGIPALPFGCSAHDGHPGYRIDQIANNLDTSDGTYGNNGGYWFHQIQKPNVILLHIGSNDILQNYDIANAPQRLKALIGQIVNDQPNAFVFVAEVIPTAYDSINTEIQAYNAQIPGIVQTYQGQGKRVYYVDQYSRFLNPDGSVNLSLLIADGVHPSQAGYNVMASVWMQGLASVFSIPATSAQAAVSFAASNGYDNSGHFCLGYSFVPNEDVNVTQLGCYDSGQDGLVQSHPVAIFDSSGSTVVSAIVTPKAPLDHLFRYVKCSPTLLLAGHLYYAAAVTGNDKFGYLEQSFASNPLITYGTNCFSISDGLVPPTQYSASGADPAWFGPNFKLTPAP